MTEKNLPAIRRPGFDPWVRKTLWRKKWQPTPVFLPGEFHGLRSLVGYGPWGREESNMTEQLTLFFFPKVFSPQAYVFVMDNSLGIFHHDYSSPFSAKATRGFSWIFTMRQVGFQELKAHWRPIKLRFHMFLPLILVHIQSPMFPQNHPLSVPTRLQHQQLPLQFMNKS